MPQIQQEIEKHLRNQIAVYRQALPIAEELSRKYDLGAERQGQLDHMEGLMKQGANEYSEMSALVASQPNSENSQTIKDSSSQLADIMHELIPLIDMIEEKAKQARQRLYPEIDESLRAQRMQNAYSRNT